MDGDGVFFGGERFWGVPTPVKPWVSTQFRLIGRDPLFGSAPEDTRFGRFAEQGILIDVPFVRQSSLGAHREVPRLLTLSSSSCVAYGSHQGRASHSHRRPGPTVGVVALFARGHKGVLNGG